MLIVIIIGLLAFLGTIHWAIPVAIICIVGAWMWVQVDRDRWYGFGEVVAFYYNCKCTVTWTGYGLKVENEPEGIHHYYCGHLGSSIHKLIKKNSGIEVEEKLCAAYLAEIELTWWQRLSLYIGIK